MKKIRTAHFLAFGFLIFLLAQSVFAIDTATNIGSNITTTGTITSTSTAGALTLTAAPRASATASLTQMGSALVSGSASGTFFGINSAGSFAGNFLDFQLDGSRKFIVDSSGKVGIGTSPSGFLHVRSTMVTPLTGTVSVTNNSSTVNGTGTTFTTDFSTGDLIKIGSDIFSVSSVSTDTQLFTTSVYTGTTAGGLTAYKEVPALTVDDVNGTNKFTVKTAGIGIGDSGPDNLLDIMSASTASLAITSTGTDTDAYIKFELTDNSPSYVLGVDDSDSDAFRIQAGTSLSPSAGLSLSTSNKVGIGVTSPAEYLHVAGGSILQTASGNPVLKSSYNPASGSPWNLAVSGNYLYVTDYGFGMRVIDISNPASLVQVGTYTGTTNLIDVEVAGKYAYITEGSNLRILDITNPNAPTSVGSVSVGGTGYDVFVSGKHAYVAVGTAGLKVVDVGNPAAPVVRSTSAPAGTGNYYGVFVSGKYAYLPNWGGNALYVIDVSNPGSLSTAGSLTGLTNAYAVYVSGRYAYVGANNTLRIVDVSNPTSPSLTATYTSASVSTSGNVSAVQVVGRYAYVVFRNSSQRVEILDVSTPSSPTLVGSYSLSDPYDIAVVGRYAYTDDAIQDKIFVLDINATEVTGLNAGSVLANTINVSENIDVGNTLTVGTGLNVGPGGIYTNGPLGIETGTVSTSGGDSITLNTASGIITDSTDVSTGAARADITLTNSRITTSSTLLANVCSSLNSNSRPEVVSFYASSNGTGVIKIYNDGSGNQTSDYKICFMVLN